MPEVVQTSAMDCGPAVLTAMLRGQGLAASLDGVRDLCATGVDGTSIDVMTDLAVGLGLDAHQLVVPKDHLLSSALGLLPAVVVTELPGGLLHFVVVWRRVGAFVEVMDPAIGRRWMRWSRLRDDLYTYVGDVDAEAWKSYGSSEAFTDPLRENLLAAGVPAAEVDGLIAAAVDHPGPWPLARLDAAARRSVRTGGSAAELRAGLAAAPWVDLEDDSMVAPLAGAEPESDAEMVQMRGAVVLTVAGVDVTVEVPAELADRILVAEPSPWALLGGLLSRSGVGRVAVSSAALAVSALGAIVVAFGLERIADAALDGPERWFVLASLVAVAALGVTGTAGALAGGRRVEIELRARLEDNTGAIPDEFFRSRLSSDLAERVHALHELRDLAMSAAGLVVVASLWLGGAVGLWVVAPQVWWIVVVLAAVVAGASFGLSAPIALADHRSRTIAGAAGQVYLDALLGALPVRAHRAEPALRERHDEFMGGWVRAERQHHRMVGFSMAGVLAFGYLVAAWTVVLATSPSDSAAEVALVAFLAFLVVEGGAAAVASVRRISPQWVVAQRLLALAAAATAPPTDVDSTGGGLNGPASFELRSVTVDGDHEPILDDVTLRIDPGEHVGLVGPSGAGKTTVMSVLLGWIGASDGEVHLDGSPMDPVAAAALRLGSAWVDPDVAVWTGTVSENLIGPGLWDVSTADVDARLGLGPVMTRLGATGSVGEAGRLLSGGEAQRLRIARAMLRPKPRLAVLDEATRGLDPPRRKQVAAALRDHFAGVTTVWITHDLDEAQHLDRIIYIENGRVLADGPPAVLLTDPTNAFTQAVAAHHALQATLQRGGPWASWELTDGALHIHPPGTNASPVEYRPDPDEPGHDTPQADADTGPSEHHPVQSWTRPSIAAAAASAVALVVVEWGAFIAGWAAMLNDDTAWWWLFPAAGIAAGASTWLLATIALQVSLRLRLRLLDGALTKPIDEIRRLGSSELVGRVLEASSFAHHGVTGLTAGLMGLAQLAAAIIVTIRFGGPLVLVWVALAWTAAVAAVSVGSATTRRRWTTERVDRTRLLLERFRSHRTETVYGPPPRATSDHLANYRALSARSDNWRVALRANPEAWLLVATATLIAVTHNNATTLLVGAATVILAWRAFSDLGEAADTAISAAAAANRFHTLLPDTTPASAAPANAVAPHDTIAASEISYAPGTDEPILDNITIAITPGTHAVLRGPSGSGKSTLATILAGLRPPNSGSTSGADRVTYVPQHGDNHTIQAELAFNALMARPWPPTDRDLNDAEHILHSLGLDTVISRMPRGLVQPVGEAGWQLSHGERARLYLARALLQPGDLLILDETLEGLEPRTAQRCLDTATQHATSIVLIHHT